MPLLSELGKFKDSFKNIANERSDLESRELPLNELELPDTEAVPMESSDGQDLPTLDDLGLDSAGGFASGEDSPFDFSALLQHDLPDEVTPPPMMEDELSDEIIPPETAPLPMTDADIPDDDFLSSLGELPQEIDEPVETPEAETLPDDSLTGLGDFDLDSLGGLDSPDSLDSLDGDSGEQPADGVLDLPDDAFNLEPEPHGEELPSKFEDETQSEDNPFNITDINEFETEIEELPLPEKEAVPPVDSHIDLGGEVLDLGGEQPHTPLEEEDVEQMPEDDFQDNHIFETEPETEAEDSGGNSLPGDDDFDLGGGSLPDFDFEPETEDTAPEASPDDVSDDVPETGGDDGFDLGGDSLPDFDFQTEPESVAADADSDFSDEGLGNDFDFKGESPGDFPDLGGIEIDTGPVSENIEEAPADELPSESLDFGGADFDLPGLDDILEKTKKDTKEKPAEKKGFFKRKKKAAEAPASSDDVEEIQLTQEDLNNLLKTLSSYPLNLRIACEELIAEQVLAPQHLTKLIRLLINGAPVKETAAFAEEISGKPIVIPKSFQKSTGAALEAEQSSFAYIFVHNFLPVLRIFSFIAVLAASVVYLGYKFVYTPIKAESLYQRGYERIPAGEYRRANELFTEAFLTQKKKKWFYLYAEAFRDERRYILAEEKYDELLRHYPRNKKGVLDYAALETYYLMNYDKANRILQQELLDYNTFDYEGLLAAGDNFFIWADSDPSRYGEKYEDARFSYSRLLNKYGWKAPVVERMMYYFIRTDNLKEVLNIKNWFDNNERTLSPPALAELGGYYLDKQLALANGEIRGVPNPYIESIEGVRALLLQAVRGNPNLPEPHYHLARYYKNLNNGYEEKLTLENAVRAFDLAKEETVRRRLMRVDTHQRYADWLINDKQFFPAEEQVAKGIELYEDFMSRNLISASAQLGKLYATWGDLEFFVKSGNMQTALNHYHRSERYGWTPPEIQYRMGSAYYQLEDWKNSIEYLFKASANLPLNRRLLFALGNTAYKRGDYYAAQGYYNRLLDILENQRSRMPVLMPNDRPEFLELGERLMMARNNAGATYEALAGLTGSREHRSMAMALYAESARAWDAITRNPESMTRMRLTNEPGAPGVNLGFLNANNALHANNALRSSADRRPEIFIRIDKDALEPSLWEELSPFGGLTTSN